MKKLYPIFFFIVLAFASSGQSTKDSANYFHNYFIQHKDSLDPIEGIWDVSLTQEYYHSDSLFEVKKHPVNTKIAIIKKGNKFETFTMSNESYNIEFILSDIKGVYLFNNYYPETDEHSKNKAVICKLGEMEYKYNFPDDYLRSTLGYKYRENMSVVNILKWQKTFPVK